MDATAKSRPLTPMAGEGVIHVGSDANTESGHRLPIVSQVAPDWMEPHAHEMSLTVPRSIDSSWRWLNDPDTFIRGQIWPCRVEFVSPDPAVPPGFHVGVLNTHHGPWMNFAGVITEFRPM